jgi:protein-S-isoprenylcysteine O-methyltransferase Ste14
MTTTETDEKAATGSTTHERRGTLGRAGFLTWRSFTACTFAVATLVLVYLNRNDRPSWIHPWGMAAGATLAVLGEALRVWGCGHLRKNQDVITSGPYAHVRNPLYLGTLLILVGICLASEISIVLYGLLPVGLLVFCAYYTPKKERVESDRLRRRFGARFDAYHDAVPGYFPRLARWSGASSERWSGSLVVSNTELPTVGFVLFGLAFVIAARLIAS